MSQYSQFAEHPVLGAIDKELKLDQQEYQATYSHNKELRDFWDIVYQVDKVYQLKPDDYVQLAAEEARTQRELLTKDAETEAKRREWIMQNARKAGLGVIERAGHLELASLTPTQRAAGFFRNRFGKTSR